MLTEAKPSDLSHAAPFDTAHLDRLMDEAGIDVLLATSKHNVQYLLGGHRAFFFDYMDAMGVSRYLPVLVYPKGRPDKAAYIGHRLESYQHQVKPLWTPRCRRTRPARVDAMKKAIDHVKRSASQPKRIGIETAFLPIDAGAALHERAAGRETERRAGACWSGCARCKSPEELATAAHRVRCGDRLDAWR